LLGRVTMLGTLWALKEISKTREGVHTSDDNGTALHKWKPMGLIY